MILTEVIDLLGTRTTYKTLAQGVPFRAHRRGDYCVCEMRSGNRRWIPLALLAELLPIVRGSLAPHTLITNWRERYAVAILVELTSPSAQDSEVKGPNRSTNSERNTASDWKPELQILQEIFSAVWLSDLFESLRPIINEQLRLDGQPILDDSSPHHVYVLKFERDEAYYVGWTHDANRRLRRHETGSGAHRTRDLGVQYDMGYVTVGSLQQAVFTERFVYRAIKKTGRKASMGGPPSGLTGRQVDYSKEAQ